MIEKLSYNRGFSKRPMRHARILYDEGLLANLYGKQVRVDNYYGPGVDIVYRFKKMGYENLASHREVILGLVKEEMDRFKDVYGAQYPPGTSEEVLYGATIQQKIWKKKEDKYVERDQTAKMGAYPESVVYGTEVIGITAQPLEVKLDKILAREDKYEEIPAKYRATVLVIRIRFKSYG